MDALILAVLQLAFVGIVYYAAYRHGFRASQEKAAAIVNQFSRPVDDMIRQLNQEIDRVIENHDRQKQGGPTTKSPGHKTGAFLKFIPAFRQQAGLPQVRYD